MRLLVFVVAGLAVVLPLFLLGLKSMVHGMLYPAPPIAVGSPPAGFREVSLPSGTGGSAVGWFFAGNKKGPVLLYFHGNGENLETLKMGGLLDLFSSFGLPLLAVDYPGYGKSAGAASERNLLRLADESVKWILQKDEASGWISAGWSLGAAVAVQAASRNPQQVKGLIALSGWNSLHEMAAVHFPGWMVGLLLHERYDSVSAAQGIHCPALVMHGEDDSIIPAALGKRLADSIPRSHWVTLPATGHNDLLSNERVKQEIASFLKD